MANYALVLPYKERHSHSQKAAIGWRLATLEHNRVKYVIRRISQGAKLGPTKV